MNLYNLLSQLRQFIKVVKDLIKDGTDRIENLCSIDVTHWKRKGDNCLQPDSMNLYPESIKRSDLPRSEILIFKTFLTLAGYAHRISCQMGHSLLQLRQKKMII